MNNNKVILNGQVLVDMTGNTVTPETLQRGVIAQDCSGTTITGAAYSYVEDKTLHLSFGEVQEGVLIID